MESRKIVFFIGSLDRGGTETYLLRFIKFLNKEQQVTVVVKSVDDGPIKPSLEAEGAIVITKQIGYFNPIRWRELWQWLKNEKFDVACDLTGNFAAIPLLLSCLAGIEIRLAFYRNSSYRFKPSFFKLIYFKVLNILVSKYATKILSNSKFALSFFFKSYTPYNDTFEIIPNGVDAKLFNTISQEESRNLFQLPHSAKIIGHVGRYNPAKNHQTIAEVATRLCQNNDNIIFVLAGKGTDSLACKALFKHVPENQIMFLGNVDNVEKLYPSFNLFYFPSITEGQPNALIEAMISDIPVVTSNIEPIKECFPKNKVSQLVEPTDIENAVASIQLCFKDEIIARQYSHFAFAEKTFDSDKRLNQFKNKLIIIED